LRLAGLPLVSGGKKLALEIKQNSSGPKVQRWSGLHSGINVEDQYRTRKKLEERSTRNL